MDYRKARLNAIGFNLTAPNIPNRKKENSIIWHDKFEELQQYRSKNGNCKVPTLYEENQPLADWVQRQRAQYKLSALSEERINMLNGIGFDWTVPLNGIKTTRKRKAYTVGNVIHPEQEDSGHKQIAIESKIEATAKEKLWDYRFKQLKLYKSKHGHCDVPRSYEENKPLGYWVHTQRYQFKISKLSDERINMLNAIGFKWTAQYDEIWYDKFEELKLYKSKHGNCNVPRRYEDNQPLSYWVQTQRAQYKKSKLSEERIRLLNAAGFEWAPSKGRKTAPNRVGNETHPEQEDSQNTKQIKTYNDSAPATYKTKKRIVEVALAVGNEICPSSHPPSYANYNSYSQYQQPQYNKSAYHDYCQPYYGHQIAPSFFDEEHESLVQDVLSSFYVNDDNDDSSTSSIGSSKKETAPPFIDEEHESLVQDILSSFNVNDDDNDSSTSSIGSTKK